MARLRTAASVLLRALGRAYAWFNAYRRTRPFWGALWTVAAGAWILRAASFPVEIALLGQPSPSAHYVMGGGLILFGALACVTPYYRSLCGLMSFLLALVAFPTASLGGYFLGTLFGLLGGSMIWAWGEKRPRKRDRISAPLAEGL